MSLIHHNEFLTLERTEADIFILTIVATGEVVRLTPHTIYFLSEFLMEALEELEADEDDTKLA